MIVLVKNAEIRRSVHKMIDEIQMFLPWNIFVIPNEIMNLLKSKYYNKENVLKIK